MRAGALRRVVQIQRLAYAQDANGEPMESWLTWKSVYAHVSPMRGQTYLQGQSQEASVDTRIRIRYQDGIDQQTMRIQHGRDIYDIKSVMVVDERRETIELMCRKQV